MSGQKHQLGPNRLDADADETSTSTMEAHSAQHDIISAFYIDIDIDIELHLTPPRHVLRLGLGRATQGQPPVHGRQAHHARSGRAGRVGRG